MYWALKELGFNIKITDGIGWDMLTQKWTSSMEHMVMVVTFDGKNYMLDVGLGLVAVKKKCYNVFVYRVIPLKSRLWTPQS